MIGIAMPLSSHDTHWNEEALPPQSPLLEEQGVAIQPSKNLLPSPVNATPVKPGCLRDWDPARLATQAICRYSRNSTSVIFSGT